MIDWLSVLVAIGGAVGGGITVIVGYSLFKQKTEHNYEVHHNKIDSLQKWRDWQEKNNNLQQKEIDAQAGDILRLRDRVTDINDSFSEFRREQHLTNDKILDGLAENNRVIAHLDGTIKGLKPIIEQAFKHLAP